MIENKITIKEPTLLIDKKKCLQNINKMAEKARNAGVVFRPHFKTHQSVHIGEWFRDAGVKCITVSSLKMAEYFADNAWDDITVAFPANLLEIDRINSLAGRVNLNIQVESVGTVRILDTYLENKVNTYIKIDIGYHRTGIWYENIKDIEAVVDAIDQASWLYFEGFLVHAGQNYNAKDEDEIIETHSFSLRVLNELKDYFRERFPNLKLSIGDTPGCSLANEFFGIDEIRPGNFIFYDIMQFILGSCDDSEIAIAMACPVVAKHHERNEIVIYGGGVHFSKEQLKIEGNGYLCGSLVMMEDEEWTPILSGGYLASLSQEHGVIKLSDDLFKEFEVGDVVCIIPVHACLTVNEMKRMYTLDGELIETMSLKY